MSSDREMDHLENMSGMNSSRHHEQPYCYHTTDEQEAEIAAQAVADDAARRVARNTTGDTKRTALAMGVDLLGGVK
jgi:hypothetical protein